MIGGKFRDYVLWRRAQEYLEHYKPLVIGVTGSYLATLTMQAVALALQEKGRVRLADSLVSTKRNLALSILGIERPAIRRGFLRFLYGSALQEMHEKFPHVIVVGIQAEKPGDIDTLVKEMNVSTAVIAAVDDERIPLFQSRQFIAEEYLSLATAVEKEGALVVFKDKVVEERAKVLSKNMRTVSFEDSADVQLLRAERLGMAGFAGEVVIEKKTYEYSFPHLVGRHQLRAPLIALAVASFYQCDIAHALRRLRDIRPPARELSVVTGKQGSIILDDTANATPQSMAYSLQTLAALPGDYPRSHEREIRRIAILGDISHIGGLSHAIHADLGRKAATSATVLVTVGDEMRSAQAAALGFKTGIDTHHFSDSRDVGKWMADYLHEGDVVLVSGSSDMHMEHVVHALRA